MAGNPLMNMLGGNNAIANMMSNNPIMQMANMLRNGQNPQDLFNQLAQKNPQMGQIMQMMNGHNSQQLGEMMRNMAQQKGVDLGQLAQQVGMPNDIATKYGIEVKQDQVNKA